MRKCIQCGRVHWARCCLCNKRTAEGTTVHTKCRAFNAAEAYAAVAHPGTEVIRTEIVRKEHGK